MIGSDRPAITGDTDELRAALAMLKAMSRRDLEGIAVLGRHSDPWELLFGFALIAIDALGEPTTTDIGAYVERLFDRIDRGQQ
jgi:hypothetical protein